MSSYADIVKKEQLENAPQDVVKSYFPWEDAQHIVYRELSLHKRSKQLRTDKLHQAKLDMILDDNGQMLYDTVREIAEYYDLNGFLDNIDILSLARVIRQNISLEEPESSEENDGDNYSDMDEF